MWYLIFVIAWRDSWNRKCKQDSNALQIFIYSIHVLQLKIDDYFFLYGKPALRLGCSDGGSCPSTLIENKNDLRKCGYQHKTQHYSNV